MYFTFTLPIVPLNLNGTFLWWSSETGEPKAMPMSRQSLAVARSKLLQEVGCRNKVAGLEALRKSVVDE
jgi:hypothetical protein